MVAAALVISWAALSLASARLRAVDAQRAALAAIEAAGGQSATIQHAGAPWRVQVIRADGSSANVVLDDRFHVVAVAAAEMRSGGPEKPYRSNGNDAEDRDRPNGNDAEDQDEREDADDENDKEDDDDA
jgi:hypothetical protein